VRVEAAGAATAVAEIVRSVEAAQARAAPVQRLADRVAGRFALGVMAASAATFAFWAVAAPRLLPQARARPAARGRGRCTGVTLRALLARPAAARPAHVPCCVTWLCRAARGLATPVALLCGRWWRRARARRRRRARAPCCWLRTWRAACSSSPAPARSAWPRPPPSWSAHPSGRAGAAHPPPLVSRRLPPPALTGCLAAPPRRPAPPHGLVQQPSPRAAPGAQRPAEASGGRARAGACSSAAATRWRPPRAWTRSCWTRRAR